MDNNKMIALEQRVYKLEESLEKCSIEKDVRIEAMHSDMTVVHQDMGSLKNTVQDLTVQVKDAVESLKKIAENTTTMRELTDLYSKWKGFVWVTKRFGFWFSLFLAALVGGIVSAMNGIAF